MIKTTKIENNLQRYFCLKNDNKQKRTVKLIKKRRTRKQINNFNDETLNLAKLEKKSIFSIDKIVVS